jgi:hypothetical protein
MKEEPELASIHLRAYLPELTKESNPDSITLQPREAKGQTAMSLVQN